MIKTYATYSVIPLQAVPFQIVSAQLSGQNVQLNVYQKSTGLYIDVIVNGVTVLAGVICQNGNAIKRNAYIAFIGELVFWDTLSAGNDPDYTGLGSRFYLAYYS